MTAPETAKDKAEEGKGVFARLRAYFFAGILVTAPIAITLYMTYVFLIFVDSKVTPLIPAAYNPNMYLPFSLPGLGLVITLVFFIMVGWLTKNFFGRVLINVSEYIVHRLPVINMIYKSIKQVFETIMTRKSQAFREVVMFEYPRPGIWTIGFVAATAQSEVRQYLGEDDFVNVFLPTTPSPTNGLLLIMRRKDLYVMKMSVEDAFHMLLSGGILTPPDAIKDSRAN